MKSAEFTCHSLFPLRGTLSFPQLQLDIRLISLITIVSPYFCGRTWIFHLVEPTRKIQIQLPFQSPWGRCREWWSGIWIRPPNSAPPRTKSSCSFSMVDRLSTIRRSALGFRQRRPQTTRSYPTGSWRLAGEWGRWEAQSLKNIWGRPLRSTLLY